MNHELLCLTSSYDFTATATEYSAFATVFLFQKPLSLQEHLRINTLPNEERFYITIKPGGGL